MSSGRGPPPDVPRSRDSPTSEHDDALSATRTEGETIDLPDGLGAFTRGQVLGERYQILEMLGRGGMGEVWSAVDLKLRVEVALKALREDLFKSERRIELLRQEVRAAREVVSPNVCRIFDLIEIEGRELVSMEYVDGATLLGVLQERGPLELKEAQDIASQFLAGLEAIHKVGLVHRDIKPENIMLTRAGRVVVMDFGLARQETEGGGSVSGTPAYMAPEQAAGQSLDARADVYSAGVVLAEMVSPEGIKSFESRKSLWQAVRSEPAKVPDSPWAPVLKKAVARDRSARFNTAHTLTRALEDVTLRVEGAEDLHPYPGLASFTEQDAEYFFGREAEVEQMWRKLDGPARLLALVGPSGAGKSSFVRAGLFAAAPVGWSCAICSPGDAPISALGRVMARETAGDADVVEMFMDFEDPDVAVEVLARWRRRDDHAVLVVDQFEELFTQNPPEEQRRFAELLARVVIDSDVHVLLSMRDDFLLRCHDHETLAPLFAELTPLGPPVGGALRRALVRPATKCGYRFEDDELVEEMLAEVAGERGALPLLAFAAAQLWESRDRETGLLTREAFHDIGGVAGALARHAEATIDRVGSERIPVVREIFRNLVTAEGTRAVREWHELLSVFDEAQRRPAQEGLHELIDARLLTSYEVREEDGEPTRRVEIIHESLLANWPRLVRWQTQDADAMQLRDQLRQAARTWDDRERPADLLWTGTAYREYALWRERYQGGLSGLEEDFARAMTAHAKRLKRRRRIAVTAAFVLLLAVLAVVGVSWQQAVAAANRAEASKLVTLGRFVLEADRTEALAYAIASLDRADTTEGRRLALRALWSGPPATLLPDLPTPGIDAVLPGRISPTGLAFSPDGRYLAAGYEDGMLQVFSRDGAAPVTRQAFAKDQGDIWALSFSPDGRLLVGGALESGGEVRVWETQGLQPVRFLQPPVPPNLLAIPKGGMSFISYGLVEPDLSSVLTVTFRPESLGDYDDWDDIGHWLLRRWPLDGGPSDPVGEVEGEMSPIASVDPSRGLLAVGLGDELLLHRLERLGFEPPRVVGHLSEGFDPGSAAFDPSGDRLAASGEDFSILLWPLDGDGTRPERELGPDVGPSIAGTEFSPDGSRLAHGAHGRAWMWDLRDPTFFGPVGLGVEVSPAWEVAFAPDGRWLATTCYNQDPYRLVLWPTSNPYSRRPLPDIALYFFHPDGSRMFTRVGDDDDRTLISLPITGDAGIEPTVLYRGDVDVEAVDPQGRFLIIRFSRNDVLMLPLDGTPPAAFEGVGVLSTLGPTGRYLASIPDPKNGDIVSVLDLETGSRLELEVPGIGPVENPPRFDSAGRLLMVRGGMLSSLDPETGAAEVLVSKGIPYFSPIGDGRRLYIGWEGAGVRTILDLEDGSRTPLAEAHQQPGYIAFDPTGSVVVSGHPSGEIRVGSPFSEQYHLLLGHDVGTPSVRILPPGDKWIVSEGSDGTTYLWPMPDVSKPPLHTLPQKELLAKLKALTNLRVVPDESSTTGYTIEADFTAFRGWETAPEW